MRNLLACLTILILAGTASATITVTVGNHILNGNQAGQVIQITVSSSDDLVYGVTVPVQIGATAQNCPDITYIDLPAFTSGYTDGGPSFPGYGMADGTGGGAIVPNGTLANVTIDTAGYTSGLWELKVSGTLGGDLQFLDNSGYPIPGVTIVNGSITVIPEPAAMLLLTIGGLSLLRRKRK